MSIQSDYDDILETLLCPECGHEGLNNIGGGDVECPECSWEGLLKEALNA